MAMKSNPLNKSLNPLTELEGGGRAGTGGGSRSYGTPGAPKAPKEFKVPKYKRGDPHVSPEFSEIPAGYSPKGFGPKGYVGTAKKDHGLAGAAVAGAGAVAGSERKDKTKTHSEPMRRVQVKNPYE